MNPQKPNLKNNLIQINSMEFLKEFTERIERKIEEKNRDNAKKLNQPVEVIS